MPVFTPTVPGTGTIRFDGALYFVASFVDYIEVLGDYGKQGYLHFNTSSLPDGATITAAFLEYKVSAEPTDVKGDSSIDLYQGNDVIGADLLEPPDPDWSLSAFSLTSVDIPHAVGVLNRIEVDETLISTTAFSDFAFKGINADPFDPSEFREDFDQTAFRLIVRYAEEPADNVKNL